MIFKNKFKGIVEIEMRIINFRLKFIMSAKLVMSFNFRLKKNQLTKWAKKMTGENLSKLARPVT
jgi:hypothetical protein